MSVRDSSLLILTICILFATTPLCSLGSTTLDKFGTKGALSNAWTQPSPYQAGQWVEYWSNSTKPEGEYFLYKIIPESNSTHWHVEVWNQTSQTLNTTSYVEAVSGTTGQHCYDATDYFSEQWDRWFDLEGVAVSSTIGPINSDEGTVTLTVDSEDTVTTDAGTFNCWKATDSIWGGLVDVTFWIDKDSNVTVQTSYYFVSVSEAYVEQLTSVSWREPPIISTVESDSLRFSATVTWTTDEIADSKVNYGPTTDNMNMTETTSSLTTAHSVALSGLSPLSTYFFEVVSEDQWGNIAKDNDSGTYYSFTTLSAEAPEITFVQADVESNSTVTIRFDTSDDTNATVWYGIEEPLTSSVNDTDFTGHHEMEITGLQEKTVYSYQIVVYDNNGNMGTSTIRNFETLDLTAPRVLDSSERVVRDKLNVTIESDEPFRCEMYVGISENTQSLVLNRSTLSDNQVMVVTGLPSYTDIYYRFMLYDGAGNSHDYRNGDSPFSVRIPDYLVPETTHPDDVFVQEGEALPSLDWEVSDQNPDSYQIFIDGEGLGEQSWDGSDITLNLEDLDLQLGLHVIRLLLEDSAGNNASDFVVMTITPVTETGLLEIFNDPAVLVLVGGVVFVGVIVVVIKRK